MIFLFYATGSAALLGTILQQGGKPMQEPQTAGELMYIFYGILPALFSFAFACWIRHHDVLIGLLSMFMRFCEDPDGSDINLSWHGPSRLAVFGWISSFSAYASSS